MKKKIKYIIIAVIAAVTLTFCLWYTRPRTLEQFCPPLELSKCTDIKIYTYALVETTLDDGSYWAYDESDEIVFASGEKEFEQLMALLNGRSFNTRLTNLIPKGTLTHRTQPGDFKWIMYLGFEKVEMPDGSVHSGYMLSIDNFYGNLSLSYELKTSYITTCDKEAWLAEIYDIVANRIQENYG